MPRLPWEDLEEALRAEEPETWLARMRSLTTNQFNQHKLLLDRFATGGELKTLFRLAGGEPDLQPRFAPWRQEACRYAPSYRSHLARFRRRIYPGEHHLLISYERASHASGRADGHNQGKGSRPLLIGFTGNFGLLMAPTPYILAALGTIGHDLLLVRRRSLNGYFCQQEPVFDEIIEHLEQHLKRLIRSGLERFQVTSLGTSAGGLASLVAAQRLGLAQGVAIGAGAGPGTFEASTPLVKAHHGRHGWWRLWKRTPLVLAYPDLNVDDRRSAAWIARYYGQRHVRRTHIFGRAYHNCTNHTLFASLVEQGVNLEQALTSVLRPVPPVADECTGCDQLALEVPGEALLRYL